MLWNSKYSSFSYRQIQKYGLQERYANDLDFSMKLKMLPALAFVPLEDLDEAFKIIFEKVEFPEECSKVIEYFEKNWMGIGRRKPSFSPDVWSCHLNVLNKLPRTNNSVEGWHKGFNELLAAHPIVWSFLDAIKNEQSKNELIYNQIISGSLQSYKLKKYKNIDDKIERLVCSYKKENLIAFLKGITCNFS